MTTKNQKEGIFAEKTNQDLKNESLTLALSCSQAKILNAHTHSSNLDFWYNFGTLAKDQITIKNR